MRGKWRWLIYALAAWEFVRLALSAYAMPWRWTLYQCLFAFYALCVLLLAGSMALMWRRDGAAAVWRHWASIGQRVSEGRDKPIYRWSLVIWIALAAVLFITFSMTKR